MHKFVIRYRRLQADAADAGMVTIEYAVAMLAAVALAGVMLKVVTSAPVQSALTALVGRALK